MSTLWRGGKRSHVEDERPAVGVGNRVVGDGGVTLSGEEGAVEGAVGELADLQGAEVGGGGVYMISVLASGGVETTNVPIIGPDQGLLIGGLLAPVRLLWAGL